ncbi:MAG: hypothetical protein Q8P02_04905, partial [Candidatus Micrarchaeota archaeon]|nr:hypothetical protein [Candidatus Micrarchaeota archaeon]
FIVTSGEETTQLDCLKTVADALGVPTPKKHVPLAAAYAMAGIDFWKSLMGGRRKLRRRYVDFLSEDRTFDISKAEKKLGYRPKVTLEKGVRELLKA